MHNIKDIRLNPEQFKKNLNNRSSDIDLKKILTLDENNRKLIHEKENLEKEKKDISKTKDSKMFEKSKKISELISKYSKDQVDIKKQLDDILSSLPNIALNDVPIGKDDTFNKEISKSGEIPKFNFKPKSHYEIGEKLNMLDFDLATKTTGSRFVFVKDKLAQLERALSNFMVDTHVKVNAYKEISPPLLASESSMFGTGQLPSLKMTNLKLNLITVVKENF